VLPPCRLVEPGVFVPVRCRPHGAGQYNVDVFAARPDVVTTSACIGSIGRWGFKSGPRRKRGFRYVRENAIAPVSRSTGRKRRLLTVIDDFAREYIRTMA
jgi:hypothetical protein